MVAYSFHASFAEPIALGLKQHTIRPHRRRHARPGEAMQLFVGMRTKQCRKIIPDPVCSRLDEVRFDLRALAHEPEPENAFALNWLAQSPTVSIAINGMPLSFRDATMLAAADGFNGFQFKTGEPLAPFAAMVAWWMQTHGPTLFEGVMISWEPAR